MYQQHWNGEESVMVKLRRDPSGAVPLGPRASFPRLRPSSGDICQMTMQGYVPVEPDTFLSATSRRLNQANGLPQRSLSPRQDPALPALNVANPFHLVALPPGFQAPPGAKIIHMMDTVVGTTPRSPLVSTPPGPKALQRQKQKWPYNLPKGGNHF